MLQVFLQTGFWQSTILQLKSPSLKIGGFTNLSEKNSPEEIVDLLNEYLTVMERMIKNMAARLTK